MKNIIIKRTFKGKSLKKPLKNKPLQEIKESDITFSFYKQKINNNYFYYFTMELNSILHPYVRTRRGKNGIFYDPLKSYKKYIIDLINKFLEEEEIDCFPIKGNIKSEIYIYKKPPETWSYKNRFYALKNKLVFDGFPDLDNVEKTAWDILADANIIWNDKAVFQNNSCKNYSEKDGTFIKIRITPETNIVYNRLNKEELNYVKEIYNEM